MVYDTFVRCSRSYFWIACPGRLFFRGDPAKRICPAGFALGWRGSLFMGAQDYWAVAKKALLALKFS